jgi:hypothetical protein
MKILFAILFLATIGCAAPEHIQRKEVLLTLTGIKDAQRANNQVRWLTWTSRDGAIVIVSEEEIYGSSKIGDHKYAFVK